jgi:hypothetical protein
VAKLHATPDGKMRLNGVDDDSTVPAGMARPEVRSAITAPGLCAPLAADAAVPSATRVKPPAAAMRPASVTGHLRRTRAVTTHCSLPTAGRSDPPFEGRA